MTEYTYLTPGPTQINPVAKEAYLDAFNSDIAAISHRGERFQKLNIETKDALRSLMGIPADYSVVWLSSGTECWERIIQNGVVNHSHHLVNGAFSERFYMISKELQRTATKTEVPWFSTFDCNSVAIPEAAELIAMTVNETSTGVTLTSQQIEQVADRYPDKLVALDAVSSAPYSAIPWKKADYVFFSVQKFFGMAAGLGALVISPRAVEKAKLVLKEKGTTGSYHSFASLLAFDAKNETPMTPNVVAIHTLGQVCKAMMNEGIDKIRIQTDAHAKALYAIFESGATRIPVTEVSARSATVICVEASAAVDEIKSKLKAGGIIVGSGYGKYAQTHLRVANFWRSDISRILDVLHRC